MSRYVIITNKDKIIRRRKLLKRLLFGTIVVLILLGAVALWFYWESLTPSILDIAKINVQSQTTLIVNQSVCKVLQNNYNYQDFVTVERNENDDVVLLSANSYAVNLIAHTTSVYVQNQISQLSKIDINVPLGTLSGIPLLSEKGPNVAVTVSQIGTVNCNFDSQFISVGVNQTLHRIYLNVQSTIDLIVPSSHSIISISTPILLCESVIVGKIPQTYLDGGFMLNAK